MELPGGVRAGDGGSPPVRPAAQLPSALITSAMTPPLARLVAELSGAAERGRRGQLVVADPVAGPGDLLAEVVASPQRGQPAEDRRRRARPGAGAAGRAAGCSSTASSERDLDIRIGGELPDTLGDPDVIVTQLPYQPGEARDLAAVLNAVDNVALRLSPGPVRRRPRPGGRPHRRAPRTRPLEDARADCSRMTWSRRSSGCPAACVPFRPGYETALWVLTQARDYPVAGARATRRRLRPASSPTTVISDLVEDVVTWRREGYQPGAHRRRLLRPADGGPRPDRPAAAAGGQPAADQPSDRAR